MFLQGCLSEISLTRAACDLDSLCCLYLENLPTDFEGLHEDLLPTRNGERNWVQGRLISVLLFKLLSMNHGELAARTVSKWKNVHKNRLNLATLKNSLSSFVFIVSVCLGVWIGCDIMLKQSRQCLHAGEWYTNKPGQLSAELAQYINRAKKEVHPKRVKALIGPHAGLYFSGPTAAWAYQYVTRPNDIKRVFIFGPSHHKYFPGCTLTYMDEYNTPIGPLDVDVETVDKLKLQEGFHMLDIDDDEDEHSIQMHLPFIAKALGRKVKIVPILTGPVNEEMAENYGKIFAPYFDDPSTLFVFSSDFCHWGEKFNFTYHNESHGQIWQSIEKLDGQAMNTLQDHDFAAFSKHINCSKNTICGRHVLFIFLKIIAHSQLKVRTKFVKYSQSEQVKTETQSSVSYASAVTFEE